jgi:hypothetical protein
MRKTVIIGLMVSFCLTCFCSIAIAGDDAGKNVGDSMYVDNKFGFSFMVPKTWEIQDISKNKDIKRVVLLEKSPTVPPQFSEREKKRFFTRPQITVLAHETDSSPKDYAEFLLAEKGKDDLKKEANGKFLLLRQDTEYSFERKRRPKSVKIGGAHGVKILGRKQYFWPFEEGQSLSDYISGYIYVLQAENGIVLVECVSERELLKTLDPDFDYIFDSFVFTTEESDDEAEAESTD